MKALVDASRSQNFDIPAVICNNPSAKGIKNAKDLGINPIVLDHKKFHSRKDFDSELASILKKLNPHLIALAGFMRILTKEFIKQFPEKIINIHPSLLPAFPGLNTHRAALNRGVKLHGCTVHFVTEQLDDGPIILQSSVPVLSNATEASLAARVLREEHRIYPLAVRWCLNGAIKIVDGRVILKQETE